MKAFLLAAGFGTRLRPLTETVPKPLVEVAGIPSICYSLYLLRRAGIRKIVCNVHYLKDDIMKFLKGHDSFGCDIIFSEEDEILGTGGGLKKAERYLSDDDFVLINSDITFDLDIGRVIKKFHKSKSPGLVVVTEVSPGEATVSVSEERVTDFRETLGSGDPPLYDYSGAAVLSPRIFSHLVEEFSSVVYTGYTGLIENDSLAWYLYPGSWIDVGTHEAIKEAEILLSGEIMNFYEKVKAFYHTEGGVM